jgi:KDO2-lipid IV(A) lauroyltransferase
MILLRALSWLPFPLLYPLARLIYILLYYVSGYRKEVVHENLKNAFPDKNGKDLTVLAKKFYLQLAQVSLEIIKARRMNKADFRERMKVLNPDLLREFSNDFQDSVIILTIHQGNWEWMLHGISAALNIPLDPIYKPLHNQAMDGLIIEIRSRFGSRPIPVAQSASDILRYRRQFRCLAMVADQSPTPHERSVWTTFMNQRAAFHCGPEAIARLTGFPILFAQCQRRSRGYYDIELQPVARPPYSGTDDTITEHYARMAERAIRQEPESWLWSNRRWKRREHGE